jgi:DNA-binding PadR family transcriptional regulator
MPRILEEDLHSPALYLISRQNGRITTSELSAQLRIILNPRGEDLEILSGRNDDKFSQIVRNLTAAERSFVKNGYIEREAGRNMPLFITDKGREYLERNIGAIKYLVSNDFKFDDLIASFKDIEEASKNGYQIEVFDENTTINEGAQIVAQTKTYKRSIKLRDKAIQFYTENDRIKCKACCFDFKEFYGEYGKAFIEIHHQKPVYQYDGEDIELTITQALINVIPVCANCHRMIHRRRDIPLSIEELKSYIQEELDFCDE